MKYEQIMLLDLDVSNNHNVEQLLWKSVFYQVIEMFRKSMGDEQDEKIKGELSKVLDEVCVLWICKDNAMEFKLRRHFFQKRNREVVSMFTCVGGELSKAFSVCLLFIT